MKKKMISLIVILCLLAAGAVFIRQKTARPSILAWSVSLETPQEGGVRKNTQASLSVPTQITAIGEDYFLVDCYHNQILTSPSPNVPLTEWTVLTDQINRGHTIAGDGTVFLADDTENNRILVFEKKGRPFLSDPDIRRNRRPAPLRGL